MNSDTAADDEPDPSEPGWAMDFDGRYFTFERDGWFHVVELDGTPKSVVEVTW